MFKLLLQKLGTGASVRSVSFEENILKSAVFVALKLFHVSCFICPTLYPVPFSSLLFSCSLGVLLHKFTLFPLSLDHWRTCFPVVQVHQRHIYTTKLSIFNPNNKEHHHKIVRPTRHHSSSTPHLPLSSSPLKRNGIPLLPQQMLSGFFHRQFHDDFVASSFPSGFRHTVLAQNFVAFLHGSKLFQDHHLFVQGFGTFLHGFGMAPSGVQGLFHVRVQRLKRTVRGPPRSNGGDVRTGLRGSGVVHRGRLRRGLYPTQRHAKRRRVHTSHGARRVGCCRGCRGCGLPRRGLTRCASFPNGCQVAGAAFARQRFQWCRPQQTRAAHCFFPNA